MDGQTEHSLCTGPVVWSINVRWVAIMRLRAGVLCQPHISAMLGNMPAHNAEYQCWMNLHA